MKLIDIMKRYNKCILKENAKLRSIYNTLIRECDGADAENECDVSECGDKEENECDTNEAEGTKMSIAEFLGECGKEDGAKKDSTDECDACGDDSCKNGEKCGLKEEEDNTDNSSKKEQIDEVNDGDLMTAEEFFGGKKKDETKADECDACGDDSCKNGEKCGLKEGEDEIDEDEELISKKEFYATNESDNEDETNEDEEIDEEVEEEITDEAEEIDENEDEKETNEDEDTEKDVTESKKDNKETELSESLEDHYRAANRKLFNI